MKPNKATLWLFPRVQPRRDVMWAHLDPGRFERILKYVKKNYTILPLLEILDTKPLNVRKPLAAITFDDGYRDFLEYSLPIMDQLKIPSAIYIVTDCITNNKPTWTFEVDYLFYHTGKLQIVWNFDTQILPLNFRQNKFGSKDELLSFCLKFKQYIKKIPEESRKQIMEDLFNSFDDVTIPDNLMMNWSEINQIIQSGVDVGSHTVKHPPLATLNKAGIDKELQQSRSDFFNYTGTMPKVISYPVGSYNQEVKDAAKLAGYSYGLAVKQKLYNTLADDKFEVPRIELYNEPFWKSWLRMKEYG